jgi:hypothetical protein
MSLIPNGYKENNEWLKRLDTSKKLKKIEGCVYPLRPLHPLLGVTRGEIFSMFHISDNISNDVILDSPQTTSHICLPSILSSTHSYDVVHLYNQIHCFVTSY